MLMRVTKLTDSESRGLIDDQVVGYFKEISYAARLVSFRRRGWKRPTLLLESCENL